MATVNAVNPTLKPCDKGEACEMPATQERLILRGKGFDGARVQNNIVTFKPLKHHGIPPVSGKVIKSSRTHLEVYFYKLSVR